MDEPIKRGRQSVEEVRLFLGRLPVQNPVRQYTEAVLEGQEPPPSLWKDLLTALSDSTGNRWRDKILAAWAIGRAPLTAEQQSRAVEGLLAVLERRTQPAFEHRVERAVRRILIPVATLCCVVVALSMLLGKGDLFFLPAQWVAVLLFVILSPISLLVDRGREYATRAAAATALGRLADPKSVDALAKAALEEHSDVRWASRDALPTVLADLTPEHAKTLRPETVPSLCALLDVQGTELNYALLDALEKVGGGRAVQPVEQLARWGWTKTLREAAARVLPVLEQRRKQENEARTLLRASEEQGLSANLLLRPAQGTAPTGPDALLRPAEDEEMKG